MAGLRRLPWGRPRRISTSSFCSIRAWRTHTRKLTEFSFNKYHLVSVELEGVKEWIVNVFFCFGGDGVP